MKQPRIKNGFCGSGDDMKTSLINGERIPKSHKVIRIFGCQERFSNDLQYFIYKYGSYKVQTEKLYKKWFNILPKKLKNIIKQYTFLNRFIYKNDEYENTLDKEDIDVLTWLVSNLNNLGAFCYWKGEEDKFCFPVEFLDYIDERIEYLQSKTEHCQDFLTFTDEKYILLDRCRIDVRELESAYAVWYEYCFSDKPKTIENYNLESDVYLYEEWNDLFEEMYGEKVKLFNDNLNKNGKIVLLNKLVELHNLPKPEGNILLMSSILNRLSRYFFDLNRYLMLKNNVEERPWSGSITNFPLG